MYVLKRDEAVFDLLLYEETEQLYKTTTLSPHHGVAQPHYGGLFDCKVPSLEKESRLITNYRLSNEERNQAKHWW
ncbi:MAG: hypothetical protein IPN14_08230 [Bacteroidetes bacterium]|nr:hypothetical protein [Bacteroidota bacterium]